MTAVIKGFDSRTEAGLRPPSSVSHSITPGQGGVAAHWGGGHLGITTGTPHETCRRIWRGWQAYHMDGHGWADIAYTLGYCQHGVVLVGRGVGVRTAAQGTNEGNDDYYAAVFLGGPGDVANQDALNALEWSVDTLRRSGAGTRVLPHQSFHSTSCPGSQLVAAAGGLDRHVITPPRPPEPPDVGGDAPKFPLPAGSYFGPEGGPARSVSGYHGHSGDLRRWQQRMSDRGWAITVDGLYGPRGATKPTGNTADVARAFQSEKGLAADGLIGPRTWAAAWTRPVT